MPYYITDKSSECSAWAVVKEDGEVLACHTTKQNAVDQMVAVSLAEGLEPGGTYTESKRSTDINESTETNSGEEARADSFCEDCDGACEVCDSQQEEEIRLQERPVGRLKEPNKRGNGMAKRETRAVDADFEIREAGDGMTFVGYAAKFNSRSENLGGFIETITPGAFRRSLRSRNDVKLLVNHDSGRVLASTRSGTLRLSEDAVGLKVEADLPNTSDGRDMAELLRRGDLSSMSFGFTVMKDTWNTDGTERSLESVRLFETSIVAFPAYQATEANVRSYETLATRTEVDATDLAEAIMKLEDGEDLSDVEAALLKDVVEKLTPQQEVTEEEVVDEAAVEEELHTLELKRKQLELILKRV